MSIFRLIEGIVSIARPPQPIGYYSFDGSVGPATNQLFDLGKVRKDLYIECNGQITARLNSTSSDPLVLPAGIWTWTDEWVNRVYLTTASATQVRIYSGG